MRKYLSQGFRLTGERLRETFRRKTACGARRCMFAALFCLSAQFSFAQHDVGSFSIVPRIGVSIANMSNMNIGLMTATDVAIKPRYKGGFAGGAEVEYQALPMLSASLGVVYSMQGCHYPDFESGDDTHRTGWREHDVNAQYLGVPLTANVYLVDGLAVRIGVETDFLLSAKWKYEQTQINVDRHGAKTYGEPVAARVDMKNRFRDVTFSVPLGVSYEYMNVVLDARYHIALSKAMKSPSLSERHRFFTFTVGYRFDM